MNGGRNKKSSKPALDRTGGLSWIEMVIPLIMVAYGFMIKFGVVENKNYISHLALYAISFSWLAVLLFGLFFKNKQMNPFLKIIIYHILTLAYFAFVSGFSIPFISVWVLLLIDASSKFTTFSTISSIVLFLTASAFEYFSFERNTEFLANHAVSIVSISILGMAIIFVLNSNRIDQEELVNSRNREKLERQKLLTIINNLTEAMLVTNKKGEIEIYNAAALNLLDTNQSPLGKRIDQLIKLRDDQGEVFKINTHLKKAKHAQIRDDLISENDEEIVRIKLGILPIRDIYSEDQAGESFVVTLRDITKEKTLEEERDEFISVVSHELRTPVAIAEGAVSNLKFMIENKSDITQMSKAVNTTYSEIIFLANMVNDLSTLSRAERGVGDTAEIIDPKLLGESLFRKYQTQVEEKGLRLNLDLDPNLQKIKTSRLYIEELLQNFLTNAIKYSKEGDITIIFKNDGKKVTFAIKDTGIGISKKDQKKIFYRFYRSEDYRTRETGGTGLGLYVASKLATKIGTKIELQSRLNYGSTFSFTLPATEDLSNTSEKKATS